MGRERARGVTSLRTSPSITMLLAPAIRIYLAHQDTQACRHPARCICPPLPVQARNVMLKSGGLGGNVIAKVECIDILFDILLAVNPIPLMHNWQSMFLQDS